MAAKKASFVRGPSTYKRVPDPLMGFKKEGRAQTPFAERGGAEYRVQVDTGTQAPFKDAVRGRNAQHALEVAERNWPGAKIRLTNLAKGIGKGLLSPAGLAEGVAGTVVKAMKDSKTYDKAMKVMKSKGGKGGPGPSRRGERA